MVFPEYGDTVNQSVMGEHSWLQPYVKLELYYHLQYTRCLEIACTQTYLNVEKPDQIMQILYVCVHAILRHHVYKPITCIATRPRRINPTDADAQTISGCCINGRSIFVCPTTRITASTVLLNFNRPGRSMTAVQLQPILPYLPV